MYIEGKSTLKVLSNNKNTYVGKASWHGVNAEKYITATTLANENDWREICLTFQASENGVAKVNVRSAFLRDKSGKVVENFTLVKDFKINGKLVDEKKLQRKYGVLAK